MKKLVSKKNINSSLTTSFVNKYSIYAWEFTKNEILIKVPLSFKSISVKSNKMTFVISDESFYELEDIISGSGKLKFYIPTLALAFESTIINLHNLDEFAVKLPSYHKFYNRRSSKRFDLISKVKFRFTKDNISTEVLCDDISMTGCSILFKQVDSLVFKDDGSIQDSCLLFETQELKIKLKLENIQSLTSYQNEKMPYANRRVAFSYYKLDDTVKLALKNILNSTEKVLNCFSKT